MYGEASVAVRKSKSVEEGQIVTSDSFAIRVPESGLYSATTNKPPGSVTLRPVDPSLDGLVYLATTFDGGRASSPSDALVEWNKLPEARGVATIVFESRKTTYRGFPAVSAGVELLHGSISQVTSLLIVKRPSDFLILPVGHPYTYPNTRQDRRRYTKERLDNLEHITQVEQR